MFLVITILLFLLTFEIFRLLGKELHPESEAVGACPKCGEALSEETFMCPSCHELLTGECVRCGREIKLFWRNCACCGLEVAQEQP